LIRGFKLQEFVKDSTLFLRGFTLGPILVMSSYFQASTREEFSFRIVFFSWGEVFSLCKTVCGHVSRHFKNSNVYPPYYERYIDEKRI